MKCPMCNYHDSKVIDSRPSENKVRRRRECLQCKHRFTTSEIVDGTFMVVVKKNGSTEPFSRDKLINRVQRATAKRPVSITKIEEMVDNIISEIKNNYYKEISSAKIGEFMLEQLRKVDSVSYIRFASVYRQFNSTDEFILMIKQLENYRDNKNADILPLT